MSTIVKRLLTAALLIPVVVWLVMFSADVTFISVLSIIMLIAGFEWAALAAVQNTVAKVLFSLVCLAVAVGGLEIFADMLPKITIFMLSFWTLMMLLIMVKPTTLMTIKSNVSTLLCLGVIIISTTWLSLYLLRINFAEGRATLMYLLLLIWIADSGAYFAGRAFGKHKLSPVISPGKSIEGVAGGLLACLVFSYFSAPYLGYTSILFIAVSLTVALVSVYGDLFESLLKRRAGVKDSGSILPGHGGMLDRIDSLLAAAPFFVACLFIFSKQL
ncbi:MAG: phosphatidate cytidylyltransferase [Piscirickettsiaceae bacterium]|nr:MAG: phosphatidate cytidylyltransferase [Piscirickettsiaceae bacterium]